MNAQTSNRQRGFAGIEVLLVVAILAVIGVVGWYVWDQKHPHTTATPVSAVNSTKVTTVPKTTTTPDTGTDNATLNSDMSSINASQTQESQDTTAANTGLNDQQSEITVPTN